MWLGMAGGYCYLLAFACEQSFKRDYEGYVSFVWWKVVQKEVEQEIRTDEEKRKEEQKKVVNVGYQRA